MVLSLEKIKAVALSLPDEQRAELAQHLLHSPASVDADVRKEWLELADVRMAEVRAGKVIGVPAEDVLKNLLEPKR